MTTTPQKTRLFISVIFPVYNEQETLLELYDRLIEAISAADEYDFEFIFVDDCSKDRTPNILRELRNRDRRVRIVRFARNCGSHAAISCGLHTCLGDAAVILAADLQDPPALIFDLAKEWEKGAKIVWGVRTARLGEKKTTTFLSRCYYALMNWLTSVKMPPTGADVFLADRVVIESFRKVQEKHTSVFMTLAWLGFEQSSIDYVKQPRFQGKSKWSLGKKFKLALDSLLAFSDIPIRYMSVVGFLCATLGFLYALYVVWCYLHGRPVAGWSSLMVAVLIIGGVQMIMLGILGEYLWRTFDESRRRPRYIVEYEIN
ncbi:MAG: glycosyltransferase [Candidatus Omnitrophica bacterium]|nr:glycosyltransferase [Candidatus Omnitrophota bacterium]